MEFISPGNIDFSILSSCFSIREHIENSVSLIKEAFDNDTTPYFGLFMCLWGKQHFLISYIMYSVRENH